jgi:hypothetical protein
MEMNVFAALLIGAVSLGQAGDAKSAEADQAYNSAIATYEHLATAIIEIEATEDRMVETFLRHYHQEAQRHLKMAESDTKENHFEAAAAQITNIANEGDKKVQAIRQRLAQAGHTHNTDESTKEDYMFIDSKEKKALVDLAKKVGQLKKGDNAGAAAKDLKSLFDKAIASEKGKR